MLEWKRATVAQVFDSRARTLGPHHGIADAEKALHAGPYGYAPIVDPVGYRLIGIVSLSDIHKARYGLRSGAHGAHFNEKDTNDHSSDMRPSRLSSPG